MSDDNANNWVDAIENAELKGFAQQRGWQNVEAVVDSFRNSERLLGVPSDRIAVIPDKADDADGWGKLWQKVGWEPDADKYGLKMPENADKTFFDAATGWMHQLKIPKTAAQGLVDNFVKFHADLDKAEAERLSAESTAELTALKAEWGTEYAAREEMARRAVREFGVTDEELIKIEQSLGTSAFLKLWSNVGARLSEHQFVDGAAKGGGPGSGFRMTKEMALSKIQTLKQDPAWTARYLANDALAKEEMNNLMAVAYGA